MSTYQASYYQQNAERLKAAARARYRQKYGGLKRGEKMRIEMPEKHVAPLRDLMKEIKDKGTLGYSSAGTDVAEKNAAFHWLYEELRHV